MEVMKDVRFVLYNMYDLDFEEKGEAKIHFREILLYPKFWNDPNNRITLPLRWNHVKFEHRSKDTIPLSKGIYCFVLKPTVLNIFETRYLFYVGKTNRTLRERFEEYLYEQQGKAKSRPKILEMLTLYKSYLHFYYSEIEDEIEVAGCEERLLNSFFPPFNTLIPIATTKPGLKYL